LVNGIHGFAHLFGGSFRHGDPPFK
jgi:hypothetical protein